jgi:hypothetical protein
MMPLTAICRPELTELQVRGYFAALGDLAPDRLAAAVKCVAATRVYHTYPMPGEIRAAADEIVVGTSSAPS